MMWQEVPYPWQLYLFCGIQLCASLALYGLLGDPCHFVLGKKCNTAELVTARGMAFGLLYVALLFFTLTYINKDKPPKKKRIAFFAAYCVVALFAGVMLTGSESLGGVQRPGLHLADMLFLFVLMAIMFSAAREGTEVAGHTAPMVGVGINPKGFMILIVVSCMIKLFATSDFIDFNDILAEPEKVTELARILWLWLGVIVLECLFGFLFTLAYGDAQDQEAVTLLVGFMILEGWASFIGLRHHLAPYFMRISIFWSGIFLVLAGIAVAGGRYFGRRDGYQQVPSSSSSSNGNGASSSDVNV